MRIPIDPLSPVPLYQQIEAFFRKGILAGSLMPETRLPASRQLAQDLGVNRITVETAYAELEADGLVYTRVGSGTYVLAPFPLAAQPSHDAGSPWPGWQQALQSGHPSLSQTLAGEITTPDAKRIDFSVGTGDPRLFPVDELRKVIQNVMRRDGVTALEYGDPAGYAPLRATIARVLASEGLQTHPGHILVTSGSQQAMALVSQLLLQAGDRVAVESPTYSGALDLFRALRLEIVGIPCDAGGMQIDALERLLAQREVKMIYCMPNFQNPTGACLSSPRRRQLLSLADLCQIPILEDDYVGDLRYEGRAQPALKALDPGGRVIYVSTFSKMLMPGLRVGFLAAEGPVYGSLLELKRASDLATSNLFQRALESYVTVGRYQAHLRHSCQVYRKRRDAMLQAIRRYLPSDFTVELPSGGFFAWLRLPESLSAERLLRTAIEEDVAFATGARFYPNPADGDRYARLNFAVFTPEQIEEGIRRLGKAVGRT